MADETKIPPAPLVDRSTEAPAPPPPDHVQLPAAEIVRLRARAEMADALERDAAGVLVNGALAEALGSIPFADDVASRHAKELLRGRIVVRPDPSGRLVAIDRDSGRPAAEALRDLANSPEFARYRAAVHGGGAGMRTDPAGIYSDDNAENARRARLVAEMTGHRNGAQAGGLLNLANLTRFGNGQ
jgi:hypothetical protein